MTAKRTEPYPALTSERLREMASYNPETGEFTWLVERVGRGGCVKPGRRAGTLDHKGYVSFMIERKRHAAHRLAFLWMTGSWPAGIVDHIDRNPANNAWANLRVGTRAQNQANLGRKPRSRPQGVYINARGEIFSQYGRAATPRYKYLGKFETLEEASQAYEAHRKAIWP